MDWQSILEIIVIIGILFGGYYLSLRYNRAKAHQSRQPGALVTKIYQDLEEFENEAKMMREGGYIINYISLHGRYILTEELTWEQIIASLLKHRQGGEPFIVNYTK